MSGECGDCTKKRYGVGVAGLANIGNHVDVNGGPGVEFTAANYEKQGIFNKFTEFSGFTHIAYHYAFEDGSKNHVNRLEIRRSVPLPFSSPFGIAAATGFEFGRDYWSVNLLGLGPVIYLMTPDPEGRSPFYADLDAVGYLGLADVPDNNGKAKLKLGSSVLLHAGVVF